MANHKSAEKRNRQNLRRYERNKVYRTHVKTATKKVLSAVENGEKEAAQEALHQAMTTISRVA
ncbi:MAG: 30S ribosomal protein S20, partial [Nitrospinaceae bacterium]|nr:30S ribosomal protein S20 [Nitrospinaceae bacterium]NIR55095.1 30S ribosomal protein S20 [Nitrospinaceae bacterium]NIS85504.1 30S ribosomal protein S20 [Nitrospinaceae bacterium]NIT82344.1 30S ribosomal protein S20 [Nitrospinaceae bacterium]NIU44560.1 30S ribosomal protein S20 [Nitrospinaceae bacterium]